MPSVVIDVRHPYTQEQTTAIINVVRSALQNVFNASSDVSIRFLVHEPERFACPPDKKYPERYMLIGIECFPGRSIETKRDLFHTLAQNLEELDIPKDHVKIIVRETPRENWGINGQAGCDI